MKPKKNVDFTRQISAVKDHNYLIHSFEQKKSIRLSIIKKTYQPRNAGAQAAHLQTLAHETLGAFRNSVEATSPTRPRTPSAKRQRLAMTQCSGSNRVKVP
jgi:hypothetical protein